jgi:uncharacterized protein HemX
MLICTNSPSRKKLYIPEYSAPGSEAGGALGRAVGFVWAAAKLGTSITAQVIQQTVRHVRKQTLLKDKLTTRAPRNQQV